MRPKALLLSAAVLGLLVNVMAIAPPVSAAKKEPPAAAPPKSRFLILLSPVHPEAAASEEEKARIVMHFDFLKTLLAEGKLILAGMSGDDYKSLVVIEATDREEAERIMASDPAVSGNVYQAELHPFQIVLSRQTP